MKTLPDVMNRLPEERRARVQARADRLIGEEMTLRDLRKARGLTQVRMAELLGIGQGNISRLEGRADMMLSTLRSYVQAMGGDLELVARFPDRPDVSLSGLFSNEKPAGSPAHENKETAIAQHPLLGNARYLTRRSRSPGPGYSLAKGCFALLPTRRALQR
jgi:transcriptional regulator with XRE-family HTH domain